MLPYFQMITPFFNELIEVLAFFEYYFSITVASTPLVALISLNLPEELSATI